MTKPHLSASLREQIARQGRYRCDYCLRTEELMGMPMTVDHIVPSAAGGSDTEQNLCPACRRCNEFKGTQTHARDSETGERVRNSSEQADKDYQKLQPSIFYQSCTQRNVSADLRKAFFHSPAPLSPP